MTIAETENQWKFHIIHGWDCYVGTIDQTIISKIVINHEKKNWVKSFELVNANI